MMAFRFRYRFIPVVIGVCAALLPVHAQQVLPSTQAHAGQVNCIVPLEAKKGTFFSAGADGMIIKWSADGMGEHYQLGDLPVSHLACNPRGTDIAVVESNGTGVNRVVVLDWNGFSRAFTKQFSEQVLSVSFSARGTYLFIVTAGLDGTYLLDAATGKLVARLTGVPGGVSAVWTGDSEKTAILYCGRGTVCYYDLVNLKPVSGAQFDVAAGLEQVFLTGTGKLRNRFLAGYRNGALLVADTMTGKTVGTYDAARAFVFGSPAQGIYALCPSGKDYALRLVGNDVLASRLEGNAASARLTGTTVATVSVPSGGQVTAAAASGETLLCGTDSGAVYTLAMGASSALVPCTQPMYRPVLDIASEGDTFYLLTADGLYRSAFDKKSVSRAGENPQQTNFFMQGDGAVLWSKGTRRPVQQLDLATRTVRTLFTPAREVRSLRGFGSALVSVQGSTSVYLYDRGTGKNTLVYTGVSVEDAILVDEHTLYVAKAASGGGDSPLVMVNVQTRETVPLPLEGFGVYALTYDAGKSPDVYGIVVKDLGGMSSTEVFAYSPQKRTVTTALKFNDEDTRAFTQLQYPDVYTNLGKNQMYAYNVTTGRTKLYRRTAAMPVKMAFSQDRIVFLNSDGTIAWFNPASQTALAEWYLTVGDEWFEF